MSLTYSSLCSFDLDHGGRALEDGLLFHLVPKDPLKAKIARSYLENSLIFIKVKQQCQKLSLSLLKAGRIVEIMTLAKVNELISSGSYVNLIL